MSNYNKIDAKKQSGFYKTADLDGKEVSHTIHFLGQDEAHYGKTVDVLHFSDSPKYFQLSAANAEALMDAFGEEPEDWNSQRVSLFVEEYKPGKGEGCE